ncbi:MarR family winged helix-turn-helix transcriptional regulator [Deinococcus peraridilitoris]|uniref:Transcriptional regulator n=1 Tax=Deinococcus peraridilitoris (strain DSM 19664 / LMG 22246 / CIP 109416 / KR-200) TaxID=937777 RepID=L0A4Y6_DEIPD|nr:MarR family transcriptional regulator [Deinococcus peraridilitoris]AFZ68948.1 transcriptional regulator [Deinococcus peraridilitoris DSM 19664]
MSATLRVEIQQNSPFRSLEEEAALNLHRTAQLLADQSELSLREYGLTPTQYNVLRILRGAGDGGLGRNEIRERLLSRMPDVTRLLDKMEDMGLVTRVRSSSDRRCVPTALTEKGHALVDSLDEPVAELHKAQFGHLTPGQLHSLIEALTLIRARVSQV